METKRLDEIGTIITGTTPDPSILSSDALGGIPFLTPSDFQHRSVHPVTERFLPNNLVEKLSRKLVPPGTTAVTCIGATIGKTTMMKSMSLTNQQINSVIPNSENDHRFIYYSILTVVDHLVEVAGGSATPILNKTAFSSIRIPVFPTSLQHDIAMVLGSLDDKIAANNDVVSASNELIRNLYRVLPASSRTLNEVASLVKNNEQPHRFLPDKRLVGLEHFDPKSLWLPRSSEPETATSAKTKFQAGDTLFGKLRPYFHKVAIAPFGGYCSTDILVLRAANPLYSPLVAAAANSDAVVQQAVNSSNGTRMPRAKWTDIEGCPIPDPDAPATLEFIDFAATLIQDATARLDENKALAKTRDELLPLLMSGKITVREAGQEAAAAGVQVPSEENEV